MEIVGKSKVVAKLKDIINKVAITESTVLITGESGTGKELVANLIHKQSNRSENLFIPINCAAIPSNLLESELFGHVKGAFTGAINDKIGKFELANNGTIFLDEIGDMPIDMQVKLLRVLQEKNFTKVGGNNVLSTNTRILAATNKDLSSLVLENKFREDLYYRLNVLPINVPTLRERREDIILLIEYFITSLESKNLNISISSEAICKLLDYSWPGNIRELQNFIERLSVMHNGELITGNIANKYIEELSNNLYKPQEDKVGFFEKLDNWCDDDNVPKDFDLKRYLELIEVKLINKALSNSNNIVAKAARDLGLRRTTLIEKIRKYKINK